MSYFVSYAQGSRFYDQLRVVDDMNDLRSSDLRPLDAMTISRLWMNGMILGHEPIALNAINISRLWMT